MDSIRNIVHSVRAWRISKLLRNEQKSVRSPRPVPHLHGRGDHPTKILPRVSLIVVFTNINYLALVPGHLNQWVWCNLDSKFGVFWALSRR